jgi:aminopeptidase N
MPLFSVACRWLFALVLLAAFRLTIALPSIELDLSLDPPTRQFKAQALIAPEISDFRFSLHESLKIVAVSADGKALKTQRLASDGPLVQWKVMLPKGATRVHVNYAGILPPLEQGRDHRSVLHGMPPMASPEGSFLPAGSGWYPKPSALFSYRLQLSIPADQRALVPGRLLTESQPSDDHYRASFEFSQPTKGIDLMAGPWVVREKMLVRQSGAPLRLRTYFPAHLDAEPSLAQAYLDDSARYLERYSDEIGAYPYSEFSVVASPLPTGFGMPTLTYIGAAVLRLPFIRKTSLGHEILHNWWGNGVYVDYAQGNWSEGLTTLMADYAAKEGESAAAASEMRLAWLRDAAALPTADQPALRDFRSRTHSAEAAVGYGKAAMVFLMLRERIGETAFRRGIREFWAQQQFRVASWQDLRLAFEHASGEKLGQFFAAWTDRRDLPQIAIETASTQPLGHGHRLSVTITQAGRPMPLHLPLELSAPGQRQTRWIDLGTARELVQLDVDFNPQQLRLDPETRVWRRLDDAQLPPILRRWIGAPAPLLINATANGEAHAAVNELAQRFFETPPKTITVGDLARARRSGATILLAGTHAEVAAALAAVDLPPVQLAQTDRHASAQVWTSGGENGSPLLVITAENTAALRAMQRALPHYGNQSWLVFSDSQVLARGVWPVRERVVPVSQPTGH